MIIATIEQLLCGLHEPSPHFTATERFFRIEFDFSAVDGMQLVALFFASIGLFSVLDELDGKYGISLLLITNYS